MKLYCYAIPPIDLCMGALNGGQLLAAAWAAYNDWSRIGGLCLDLAVLQERAEKAFRSLGWDGEILGQPQYFALPASEHMTIGYACNRGSNVTCFVASREPLAYLDTIAFERSITDEG